MNLYALGNEPPSGIRKEAYDVLDTAFGTNEFTGGQAVTVISQALETDKAEVIFKDLMRSDAVTSVEGDKPQRMFVRPATIERSGQVHYEKEPPSTGAKVASGVVSGTKKLGNLAIAVIKHVAKDPGVIGRAAIGNSEAVLGPQRRRRLRRDREAVLRGRER